MKNVFALSALSAVVLAVTFALSSVSALADCSNGKCKPVKAKPATQSSSSTVKQQPTQPKPMSTSTSSCKQGNCKK